MRNNLETWRFPRLRTYARAFDFLAKTPKVRGKPERAWLRPGKRTEWIERLPDGSFSIVRHGMECVRWMPDFSVWLTPHRPFRTMGEFTNVFTPVNINVYWAASPTPIVDCGRVYGLDRATRFARGREGMWLPTTQTVPFHVPELDKAAARAALARHGYPDFMAYARARMALGGRKPEWAAPYGSRSAPQRTALLAALADPSEWEAILNSASLSASPDHRIVLDNILVHLRRAIYHVSNVVRMNEREYLDSQKEYQAYYRARNEYRPAWLNHNPKQ